MARVVPPIAIPPVEPTVSAAGSPRESISGDVTYRLGGQFWPSRASAKLHGDLLLIQRRDRQEAAVQLSGALVELQGSCSIKIEGAGTQAPLVMRLDNQSQTDCWLRELQAATERSKSYREMLRDVPMLSPRSEATPSPEMQSLRSRLSQEEAATREMEMSLKAAELRADAQLAQLRELRERLKGQEKAINEEQEKRKQAELQVKELQAQLGPSGQLKQALLDERVKLQDAEKQIQELQNKLTNAELTGQTLLQEQQKRRQAETTVQELQNQLEEQVAKAKELQEQLASKEVQQDTDASRQLQLLQHRLASAEQRLVGEEQWRKVAEESKAGAERRVNEMEEILAANVKKLRESQQKSPNADDEARKKLEDEIQELRNAETCRKATEEQVSGLQSQIQLLQKQLIDLAQESKAQMMELHDQWLSKEQAAKLAYEAELENLQTQLAFQRAAAAETQLSENERKELKGALESEHVAREAAEKELQDCKAQLAEATQNARPSPSMTLEASNACKESESKNLELQEQLEKLEGEAVDLRRRLKAAMERHTAEEHRRQTAEERTKDMEARLSGFEEGKEDQGRRTNHLQGRLEAAMIQASREAQAKTVAQRQLMCALKAATAAGAKIKAAEAWSNPPSPSESPR